MKGLLALAKGKSAPAAKAGAPAPMPEESPPESSGGIDAFAREAFGALRDGDEAGFVEAFKGAVRACMNEKSSEYPEG